MKTGPKPKPLSDRFWSKVDKRGPDECWPWLGSTIKRGYGKIGEGGRTLGAHVVSLMLDSGEQPEGRHALHSCDNPVCVNPKHLRWGTRSDNSKDCVARGRHVYNLSNCNHTNRKRGEDNHRSRFTESDVIRMRQLYELDKKQTEIAKLFDCRQSDISRIVRRKAWRHV